MEAEWTGNALLIAEESTPIAKIAHILRFNNKKYDIAVGIQGITAEIRRVNGRKCTKFKGIDLSRQCTVIDLRDVSVTTFQDLQNDQVFQQLICNSYARRTAYGFVITRVMLEYVIPRFAFPMRYIVAQRGDLLRSIWMCCCQHAKNDCKDLECVILDTVTLKLINVNCVMGGSKL